VADRNVYATVDNARLRVEPAVRYPVDMMKLMLLGLAVGAMAFAASSVYDFTLNTIDGSPAPLASFKGKVVLLVNVASKCGYTPQYAGLEKLYETYKDKGFVIVGVPANNFGSQEPGSNEEIKTFCSRNYNVTFPMMSKVSVKGADTTPLYQYLTDKGANPKTGGEIKWNFTKFLLDKNGNVINRFEPAVTPEAADLVKAVEAALAR
jgi:glutathione peroxidase